MHARRPGLVALALAFGLGAGCTGDWTTTVRASAGDPVTSIDADGVPCFDVVVYGAGAHARRVVSALREACASLRDPVLRAYLDGHRALLKPDDRATLAARRPAAYLSPEALGAAARVAFYVTATRSTPPA